MFEYGRLRLYTIEGAEKFHPQPYGMELFDGVDRMVKGAHGRSYPTYPQEGSPVLSTTLKGRVVDNRGLSDAELLRRADELAVDIRVKTCDLVESLAEIDRRKLYRDFECGSLFDYCVLKLKMSRAAAFRRIRAARAIRIYPPTGDLLRSGQVNLEMLALLHPYLNDTDAGQLIRQAAGRPIREVEELIAGRRTEEPRRDVVRLIAVKPVAAMPALAPTDTTAPPAEAPELSSSGAPEPPAASATEPPPAPEPSLPNVMTASPAPDPLGHSYASRQEIYASVPPGTTHGPSLPARHHVRVAFTADESFAQLLGEVQAAMRHKYPDGRLEGIFRDALKALLKKNRPWAVAKT